MRATKRSFFPWVGQLPPDEVLVRLGRLTAASLSDGDRSEIALDLIDDDLAHGFHREIGSRLLLALNVRSKPWRLTSTAMELHQARTADPTFGRSVVALVAEAAHRIGIRTMAGLATVQPEELTAYLGRRPVNESSCRMIEAAAFEFHAMDSLTKPSAADDRGTT